MQADWAYLSDHGGRHFFHLGNGEKRHVSADSSQGVPSRAIYGIATRDLVSCPLWVTSQDDDIIAQVVAVENERLGVRKNDGPGKAIAWRAIERDGARTLVQSIAIPWPLDDLDRPGVKFTGFVPQHAFFPPPSAGIALWREGADWVAGYTKNGQWAHIQPLGDADPATIAQEITLTHLELSAKDCVDPTRKIVVWDTLDKSLEQGLSAFDPTFEPPPSRETTRDWSLEPHEVAQQHLTSRRQSRNTLIGVAAILLLFALIAAGMTHLWLIEQENRELAQKVAANRADADRVEAAIDAWTALSPAFDTDRAPLEIFHQVTNLLPEKGFRLTDFEFLDHDTILLKGEGSTMANALQLKGALESAPALSSYTWEIPPPQNRDSLYQLVATGTYRF